MLPVPAATLMLEGAKLNPLQTIGRACLLALASLVLIVAQRVLWRQLWFRSLALQLNLLVIVLLLLMALGPVVDQMNGNVRATLEAIAMFLAITSSLKLLDFFFLERLPKWRNKPQVPLVLRDIGRWVLAGVALVLIVRAFFPGVNLNVLAVSSLVVGYIVGNATQDTLGNLFAGLALNAERPFQIGDWVTVGSHTGLVVDTTWRATRLRTKTEDYVIIPNSSIGKESILNFSRPTRTHGCFLSIGVSYDTPPNKARATILNVLREVAEISKDPPPSVFLVNYGNFSIDFKIKFFIEDFQRIDTIQSTVLDRIWYAFRRDGIAIPYPVQVEHYRNAAREEQMQKAAEIETVRASLSGVNLFQSLSREEMDALTKGVKLKAFAKGESLCRQGEAGDSFYVIREGQVAVFIKDTSGNPVRAAYLDRGAFFGEMSLLTGEPRSGTVTAETDVEVLCVSKADFAGLLRANISLAEKLATALEARSAARRAIMTAASGTTAASDTRSALTERILQFFGLSKPSSPLLGRAATSPTDHKDPLNM